MPRKKRGTRKSYNVGDYRERVSVYQETNGVFYMRVSGKKPKSLGHRSFERAKRRAKERHAELVREQRDRAENPHESLTPTVERVVTLYLKHQSPRRSPATQAQDRRRAAMWKVVLGPQRCLAELSLREWDTFTRDRQSGTIDARGHLVVPDKRRLVRSRAVGADQEWLRSAINWAVRWRDEDGTYVMRENPVRGFEIEQEKNVRRPVATHDRFEALRAVSDAVPMIVRRGGKQYAVRSYLSEILDLVNGTGRRIGAVIRLRYANINLKSGGPHGAITWPAESDKEGKEWTNVPLSPDLRATVDRILAERPGVGQGYLFPSPANARKHVSRELVRGWMLRGEQLAGLAKQTGSLFHAYRRKWATERKGYPDSDVMKCGGWSDPESLKLSYQQADPETMLRVMTEPTELREAESA